MPAVIDIGIDVEQVTAITGHVGLQKFSVSFVVCNLVIVIVVCIAVVKLCRAPRHNMNNDDYIRPPVDRKHRDTESNWTWMQ